MKPEIRALLGKAAYEGDMRHFHVEGDLPAWEEQIIETRERYEAMAVAIAVALADLMVPALIAALLTEQDVDRILASCVTWKQNVKETT
jgi:hypothetical protein